MLTGDLVQARVRQKQLLPVLVDPTNPALQDVAYEVLQIIREATEDQHTRGHIGDCLKELAGERTDHKLIKGLGKVLSDRCEFETQSPMPPLELRERLFKRAATAGPLALRAGPTGRRTADDIVREVAEELGCTPIEVHQALYADLKEEQRVCGYDGPPLEGEDAPEQLLERYNVALVQALLLKATHMVVRLEAPDPKRVRQLFRYVKFFQLMYRVSREGKQVVLELDGPESLLRQSTRYGLQLATFLPAILLQPGTWSLEAEVMWGRGRKLRKQLKVDSKLGLRSHYRDRGAWRSRTELWLEERWEQVETKGWTLGPGELIDLGGQRPLVPDFTFRKGDRVGHLDIVGYWRKGYLQKRIEETPAHVLLAVSRKLSGEKTALPKTLQARVITFAEVIPVGEVVKRLDAHAVKGGA